ncbi:tRNA (guanine(46)-N(7))-methyltransferase TrmB [Slackia heliotrinireducens]|uniref:tRNA (guanine(46)-N(7))-methyltransferase TrmB n=1 Tax=Slackia heliotrinireducens TaxID=84110 RepID=UPI003315F284
MRSAASRKSKNFDLEGRLAAASSNYEADPSAWAGKWRCWHPADAEGGRTFDEVRVDLGCGKGAFAVEMARRNPNVLFVGLDVDGVCALHGAENAIAAGLDNLVFAYEDYDLDVAKVFGEGEISLIYMNFPTPFPRKKMAPRRITYLDRLMAYRPLLAEGGTIRLKTDSFPFRDFSVIQFELAGYDILWQADDMRAAFPDEPDSEYERKLTAKGATVMGLEAKPGPAPDRVEQTAELSLFQYLPDDLESMDYIPHGMDGAVNNWVNRDKNAARKERARRRNGR